MNHVTENGPRDPRSHGIFIKVTESEYETIHEIAAGDARRPASWIYAVVRREITRVRHNESQNRAREIRRTRNSTGRGK